MEIRPTMQSCNVYIKFRKKFDGNVRIDLKTNEINISYDDEMESVEIKNCKILPNSLSCLQIMSDCITFRFLTQNDNREKGQFKTEFVLLNMKNDMKKKSINSNPVIMKDVPYKIKCNNCLNELSNEHSFRRILPLPSENMEMSDWFCHKHDDSNAELSLNPKICDCFYSNCYIHLNENVLKNVIKSENGVVVCKRCLFWLGLDMNKETFQLWHNTINLYSNTSELIASKALKDFNDTVKKLIYESILGFTKFIFECQNTNSDKEYLSICIMEKSLRLYLKRDDKFEDVEVAKVLYRFDKDVSDLLESWMNDVKVSQIKISKPMMVSGLKHLYEMSQLIPACYSKSNDYFVSYLTL